MGDFLPCSWDDGKCAMKKKPTEEVCVEEMKACAADEKCSMLHEKLQAAMKKDGGYGGKGGDGKYDDKKEGGYGDKKDDKKEGDGKKEGGYDGKKEGDGKKPPMQKKGDKDDHDDEDHDDDGDDKKKDMKDYFKNKEDYPMKGGRRRQLEHHGDHSDNEDKKKPPMKKDGESDKGYGKKDSEKKYDDKKDYDKKDEGKKDDGKKDGDYKKDDGKDKKDMEPSAELKAAMKACTENELCKKLMECKKKHKESGGKGDG